MVRERLQQRVALLSKSFIIIWLIISFKRIDLRVMTTLRQYMQLGITREPQGEDVWVKTICNMCYNCCGINVHRVNGLAVKIEGDYGNPHNQGKVCAKGNAGLFGLYDPNRVLRPLKRTNKMKGIGVDPGWVEIGWEEALSMVARELAIVRKDDPRKLVFMTFDTNSIERHIIWCVAYGSPNFNPGAAQYYCGNAVHPHSYMTFGTFYDDPDFSRAKYSLLIGCQYGFVLGTNAMHGARSMADGRCNGMKLVVVDPVCTNAAAKADEWIPIRPGTDGAFALAVLNVLLNEKQIFDVEFLKRFTNGPYLAKPDGHYARDKATTKPLVWDVIRSEVRPYDAADSENMALEGSYRVDGLDCKTAFQMLKDHVKQYTPEWASEITTIEPSTIRRIATEIGAAASIGATVQIEGQSLPYRPVVVAYDRGISAHKNGYHTGLAIRMISIILGAVGVVGSTLGSNAIGPGYSAGEGPEGMLVPGGGWTARMGGPYPPRKVERSERLDLFELFPLAIYSFTMMPLVMMDKEKFQFPYEPEILIQTGANPLMSTTDPDQVAEWLKKFRFQISIVTSLNETAEFADIVLPEAHYLERYEWNPNMQMMMSENAGPGCWYWTLAQQAVAPSAGVRSSTEILLDLAERAGFIEDVYVLFNAWYLKGDYKLDVKKRYTWEEIIDHLAKSAVDGEHGLEYFKKHSYYIRKKTVEEAYPRPFLKGRIHLYYEYFSDLGEQVRKVWNELDIPFDTSDYLPLPAWKPCRSATVDDKYDLSVVSYKVPTQTNMHTANNPSLFDLDGRNPSTLRVLINRETAMKKGVNDDDLIIIESEFGKKLTGRASVTERVHPEVIAIAGGFGQWAKKLEWARGRGVHWNALIPHTLDRIDPLSTAVDTCVRTAVYKE